MNNKMTELKARINEFENYIKEFKKTKYDYHCAANIECLYNELKQLKDWLDINY